MTATASTSSFRIVLPGDIVRTLPATSGVRLGPGVVQAGGISSATVGNTLDITATRSGIVGALQLPSRNGADPTESSWVEASSRRYVPALGEPVVGVVVARHAEGYRVDIGSAQMAGLDALAFEDATKRNKPNLKVGTVVYGRLSLALPFCEPEMECVDPKTGKAQGFGELTGGMLIRNIDLDKCRALLSPNHSTLTSLSSKFPFEIAIGVNGRIWVKADDIQHTITVIQTIKGG